MTLGELINELKKMDVNKTVPVGFGSPHSYRGYYEDLAFEPAENVTIGSMLTHAESALGKTFQGYKGGDYVMEDYTTVWIANYGESGGEVIGPALLWYIANYAGGEG